MAENSQLKESFELFAAYGGGNKKDMTGKNFSKCCKDTKVMDGKRVTSTDVDIVFSKVKAKAARVISYKEFVDALTELSKKRFPKEPVEKTFELVEGKSPMSTGVTKTSKTGGVEKMTDASQYTGSHKERFDASGKGKGLDGRAERVENTGYVGNYKGSGTYEEKVGK